MDMNMETVQVKVDGMSCGSCANAVTNALMKVHEVSAVEIDLPGGVATVTTQGASAPSLPAILSAVTAAGYDAALFAAGERAACSPPANAQKAGCGSESANAPKRSGGCCGRC